MVEHPHEGVLKAAQRVIDLRALEMANTALTKINSHEDVCAERWKNVGIKLGDVSSQLSSVNKVAIRIGFGTIGLLLMIVAYFLDRFGMPGH